jgi:TRAP-type C4-dicarboxylate transport system permease small subunit
LTQKIHITGQKTPALQVPFSIVYFAAVAGFFIASIRCGQDIVTRIMFSGKSLEGKEVTGR